MTCEYPLNLLSVGVPARAPGAAAGEASPRPLLHRRREASAARARIHSAQTLPEHAEECATDTEDVQRMEGQEGVYKGRGFFCKHLRKA